MKSGSLTFDINISNACEVAAPRSVTSVVGASGVSTIVSAHFYSGVQDDLEGNFYKTSKCHRQRSLSLHKPSRQKCSSSKGYSRCSSKSQENPKWVKTESKVSESRIQTKGIPNPKWVNPESKVSESRIQSEWIPNPKWVNPESQSDWILNPKWVNPESKVSESRFPNEWIPNPKWVNPEFQVSVFNVVKITVSVVVVNVVKMTGLVVDIKRGKWRVWCLLLMSWKW